MRLATLFRRRRWRSCEHVGGIITVQPTDASFLLIFFPLFHFCLSHFALRHFRMGAMTEFPFPHLPTPPLSPPSTAISRVEPDFSFKTQPAALARKKDSGSSPKGKLFVKLIAARHLSAPSAASRPYVVVTFDQNEFVSREPIHEEGEEAVGVARVKGDASPGASAKGPPSPSNGSTQIPEEPMNSPTNTSTLSPPPSGSGLGRALSASPRNGSVSEGSSSSGTASPAPPPRLAPVDGPAMKVDGELTPQAETVADPLASLSAYNPTWKHEVFLYVAAWPRPCSRCSRT